MGHFGVSKTLDSALLSGLDEANLRKDIIEFIKFCPTCQKMSYIRPITHSQPFVLSSDRPMHKVCIDSVGPFPVDAEGYTYIIVIIDS